MDASDILFLALAACAVALTVFVAWFLYELVRILRGVARTVEAIEEKLKAVDALIELAKDKLHSATSALTALTAVVTSALRFVQNKRQRKKTRQDDEF